MAATNMLTQSVLTLQGFMQFDAAAEALLDDEADFVDLSSLLPPAFSERDCADLVDASDAVQQACHDGACVFEGSVLLPAALMASCKDLAKQYGVNRAFDAAASHDGAIFATHEHVFCDTITAIAHYSREGSGLTSSVALI